MTPPPLPPPATPNTRLASFLNIVIPGAGLFILGRRVLGAVIAVLFLACFGAALLLFLIAYGRYISLAMSEDIFKGDNLERVGTIFPQAWLAGLAGAGVAIQLLSMVLLRRAKRSIGARPDPLAPKARTKGLNSP